MDEQKLRQIVREEVLSALNEFQINKKLSNENMETEIIDEQIGVEEAADWLGLKKSTVYNLVSSNKIPFKKRGKLVSFDKKQLLTWVTRRKHLDMSGTAPDGFNYANQAHAIYQEPPGYWKEENWD